MKHAAHVCVSLEGKRTREKRAIAWHPPQQKLKGIRHRASVMCPHVEPFPNPNAYNARENEKNWLSQLNIE